MYNQQRTEEDVKTLYAVKKVSSLRHKHAGNNDSLQQNQKVADILPKSFCSSHFGKRESYNMLQSTCRQQQMMQATHQLI